ncbi:hypothetical protein [Rhodococcus spelaei]|uniref:hypothetical protein n=1 Tax=Rhodococcus spelaei TaxID=2546320 RepID=UPI0015EE749B|nr:hypothetical protein [Rhodococcus spelaei]
MSYIGAVLGLSDPDGRPGATSVELLNERELDRGSMSPILALTRTNGSEDERL